MEQILLRSSASQAKIIGAILSIFGALVVVLYKGPKVLAAASFTLSSSTFSLQQKLTSFESSWIIGGLLLASQYFLLSVWYILQTRVMEVYPEAITVIFFYNLFATLISAPVCLFAESNLTSWVLKPDISLAAIIYSGVFVSLFSAVTLVEKDDSKAWIIRFDITLISVGATGILNSGYYIIHTWAVSHKGPVYLSMFKPLSILIAAASTTIFLGESIYLGILIGGILISIGFYMVLWGKSKEDKVDILVTIESSPSHKAPLLGN